MSDRLFGALSWFFVWLIFMDIGIRRLIRPPWLKEWDFAYTFAYVITTFFIAVGCLIRGRRVLCVLYSFYCVAMAYMWWHDEDNKRKRKKLLDKAAGRVKDLGGRLKVVKPSET